MTSYRVVYLEPIPSAVEAIIRERIPEGFEVAFRQ
jgi:hypothetical protein